MAVSLVCGLDMCLNSIPGLGLLYMKLKPTDKFCVTIHIVHKSTVIHFDAVY